MPKELEKRMPALYEQEDKGKDAIVYAHYFCIASGWDWYATEYDPKEGLFFGLVKGFATELGYFTLGEFEELNKKYLTPIIERDLHWTPCKVSELYD